MNNWKTMETAPTDGTAVDLWVENEIGGERYPDMVYREGDAAQSNDWEDKHGMFSVVGDGLMRLEQVTHWMPAPEGPSQ